MQSLIQSELSRLADECQGRLLNYDFGVSTQDLLVRVEILERSLKMLQERDLGIHILAEINGDGYTRDQGGRLRNAD